MRKVKDNKSMLLFVLISISFIMVVGFAAFNSTLTINGTASTNPNWCIGFDNRNTSAYTITKGKSTGTSPTGSIGFSGSACSTNYVPVASLGATFYQPGDKIEYTLTIANKGSINAVIESITVDNTSVTSDQIIQKGNIIWKVYMTASTTLAASTGTTTMVVSAEFQNTTDLESYTAQETQSITVGIVAAQNTGSNAMVTTEAAFTGVKYAINTDRVNMNDTAASTPIWCATERYNGGNPWSSCEDINDPYYFTSLEDCNVRIASWGTPPSGTSYSCEEDQLSGVDLGTTYNSCAATGKNACLKYTIENNIITGVEACFIKGGTEYCLTGWHNEFSSGTTPIYNLNVGTLNTAFTEINACSDDDSDYVCSASGLEVTVGSGGGVSVIIGNSWYCLVNGSSSYAYCIAGNPK
ncbi:MAG: hypothetical protein IKG27_02830 [Bacilli bacterium]|nr:hypothetical protein [Bacilli bacterium]